MFVGDERLVLMLGVTYGVVFTVKCYLAPYTPEEERAILPTVHTKHSSQDSAISLFSLLTENPIQGQATSNPCIT